MSSVIPLLRMQNIEKSFPGVKALKGVSLDLFPGEVLGLVGENGAGKSTLMKVLGGAHQPESGSVAIEGETVRIASPVASKNLGISIIYQELNMIPAMTAQENLFLGRERTSMGFVKAGAERHWTLELFKKVGIDINPRTLARDLSVAQQQGIEIAKALSLDAKVLVMDEPTAALTNNEVEALFRVVKDLRARGLGVIYISHRLDEIFELCDRVTVIRDGESVGTRKRSELTRPELIEMMVGRKMEQEFPPRTPKLGGVKFEVRNLGRGKLVRNVNFTVRAGEIVALVGLMGAGRTETARLLFGADRKDSGEILLDGKAVNINSPRDSIRSRIALLTEDRKSQGLVLIQSIRENFSLPNLRQWSRWGFINRKRESAAFGKYREMLRIKAAHENQLVKNLSGGNQQKVVLAKWLQVNCEVVIFDEPTRGVDVGAKY
ncbi:MAG: sugar ABC transporter ATP-binding protein, partial [Planctomycetota bacterium]|nr:sugar ABC transporter ATP-binding protein [Planctomycetota bacterium]